MYQKALVYEFKRAGLIFEFEKNIPKIQEGLFLDTWR